MERRAIAIHGIVQGVGFRPFVHELARGLGLVGFVKNRAGGVEIEVEGEASGLNAFLDRLVREAPPLSRIEDVTWQPLSPRGERRFSIEPSQSGGAGPVAVSPDAAVCDACLAEMRDPGDRRYGYPFINCTHCGPRLTIVTGAPYDRPRTTMVAFAMCSDCRAEYDNPQDRRFHAQPIACPKCGPKVFLRDRAGGLIESKDPIASVVEALISGKIAAIKGLGGYHLACDARNDAAVGELRRRKHRYEKPLAVMVEDMAAAQALCRVGPTEQELLGSVRRPIVLLARHSQEAIAAQVAPGNPMLGVMLPYTPLHHLLMQEMKAPLVMTSGNRSDEPIVTGEPEVFERLCDIAEVFLTHDRPIHVRCDDSVTRVIGADESPIRRSRGYAPQAIRLPVGCPAPILAVGGQLKGTFALGLERRAILSHHLGDLDHFQAYRAFERDIGLYERLFAIRPQYIAHDLHPDYASTRYAQKRAADEGITLIPIQHHHAHMASCMAEHDIDEPVIGVSFDGAGLGTDGAIWGGEFLVGDFKSFRRGAHLRYVPMPGGERAVQEPWRMAMAHLADARIDCPSLRERIDPRAFRAVQHMVQRRFNAPLTSSVGRLFDAIAALVGLRDRVSFEGQAAMQLEWIATGEKIAESYPFETANPHPHSTDSLELDTRPMIRAIVADLGAATPAAIIARRFHSTLVELILQTCRRLGDLAGITKVVLSGGVFMNALLVSETASHLKSQGFYPFHQHQAPPNDGGLSLGQVAIAARQIGESQCV